MKHTLYITTLVVATLACGLCMPALAETIDFSDQTPGAGWAYITANYVTPSGEYTLTPNQYVNGGIFLVNGTFGSTFTDTCFGTFSQPVIAVFTRAADATFSASSITVGDVNGTPGSWWQARGITDAGATPTVNLPVPTVGNTQVVALDPNVFNNLTSLSIIKGSGFPAFDDLVLGDPIAGTRTFVSGVAVTFNGTAADGIAMNIAACDGHEENGCV